MKKTSLSALVAAGLLAGGLTTGKAQAADLGGTCCADLEERIAELEARTVRKGNRQGLAADHGPSPKPPPRGSPDGARQRSEPGSCRPESSGQVPLAAAEPRLPGMHVGWEPLLFQTITF
jgi:hypothetical protein